ncbi:MAG: PQQ-binding-like beta-propeller repeat protein, partial [Verrucomicrobiota bacterium]|nr:PQQ-binding-like beta-propeller repeat protein [Verrucomicrobiota bacterium]
MKTFVSIALLGGVLVTQQAPAAFNPTDWPMWRGLHGDGHAKAVKGLPLKWNDSRNVIWKIALPGRGHSTPTIVGNRIYLATAETEKQVQSVLCFEKATGKLIWKTPVHKGNFVKGGNKHKSDASSSVVCDGTQLYVSFPNNNKIHTTALGMEGKVLWQRAVTDYVIHQGFGTSPTVYRDVVVAKADSKEIGGAVVGLNKKSGQIIWKINRPKYPNYTTPVMVTAHGKLQMVFAGAELITSIDPLTGKKHWEFPGSTQECVATAVTDGKRIFVSGGWPKNHIAAIEADGSGKITWQNSARVYVPSMLMKDGHLYAAMDAGFAACWDSATGRELWKERLGGAFFASPVLVGERIYATNLAGKTFVYSTNPKEFRL